MKNLIVSIIVLMGLLTNNIAECSPDQIPYYIAKAANQFGIDKNLMYAICLVESKCNARAINTDDGTPDQKAAGIKIKSYGLFQLQIETAKVMGFVDKEEIEVKIIKHYMGRSHHKLVPKEKIIIRKKIINHTKELLDPSINAFYAAAYIAHLYTRYVGQTNKVISAYNAGHYTKSNDDYVFKVLKFYVHNKIDRKLK